MFDAVARVRVSGMSMAPTYSDGDVLLVSGWLGAGRGDVVIATHPHRRDLLVLKRITDVRDDRGLRQVWLEGDNPDMSRTDDSWRFGWVDSADIRARVIMRIARRGRMSARPAQ